MRKRQRTVYPPQTPEQGRKQYHVFAEHVPPGTRYVPLRGGDLCIDRAEFAALVARLTQLDAMQLRALEAACVIYYDWRASRTAFAPEDVRPYVTFHLPRFWDTRDNWGAFECVAWRYIVTVHSHLQASACSIY